MKRTILQRLSTLLAFIVIIPLTILSVVACVNQSNNSDEDNGNEIHNPINPSDKKLKFDFNTEQNPIINGIYYYESDVSFNDAYFLIDENELYSYFKTSDFNGVKRAVTEKGFDEFVTNITKANDQAKYIEFSSNNKVSSYTLTGDEYTLVNENEFTYNYENSKFSSTGKNPLIINKIEDKEVSLYFPFFYELENGETEITPLYVKAVLKYKAKSYETIIDQNIASYKYQSNTCKLVYDFDYNIDTDKTLNKLKSMFNLEDSENILGDIENIISSYKYSFDSNFSVVTLQKINENLSFSYHSISNLTFDAFNGINIRIINKTISSNQLINELKLSINIDNNVTLQFTIEIL